MVKTNVFFISIPGTLIISRLNLVGLRWRVEVEGSKPTLHPEFLTNILDIYIEDIRLNPVQRFPYEHLYRG